MVSHPYHLYRKVVQQWQEQAALQHAEGGVHWARASSNEMRTSAAFLCKTTLFMHHPQYIHTIFTHYRGDL